MDLVTPKLNSLLDVTLVKLARELAMGIKTPEEILTEYKITDGKWAKLQEDKQFLKLLESEVVAWNSATNTNERVKLKAAAAIEEYLCEAFECMHDKKEPLSARVELAKLLARLGGVGLTGADAGMVGEKLSVTINLGADSQLKFEKAVTPKVIDHEPVEAA